MRTKLLVPRQLVKLNDVQRFRLALLVLVEGILCPTIIYTVILPQVVNMHSDLDEFIKFPWGRESFLLTVRSVKTRKLYTYNSQGSIAIQGFAHAITLIFRIWVPSKCRLV